MVIGLTPVRDRTGPARLLDMVEGLSKAVFKDWLAARPALWPADIEVVATDGCSGLKIAAAKETPERTNVEEVPEATTVMDPFRVVYLAADALARCRRRIL